MKKFLTFVLALIIACSTLGLVACENNAGDVTDGACQHSINADGVCSLCGKDILAKWRAVFDDAEKYKAFSGGEYTMKTTYSGYAYINGVKEEHTYIETIKSEKNKVYEKYEDIEYSDEEYYYEYLPDENTVIHYYGDSESGWLKRRDNNTIDFLEIYYSAYRFIGVFESMVPTKIEYKNDVYYVYYSMYGGMEEYTVAVKDDLITCIEGKMTIGGEEEFVKIEINYDDVNIVLPNAVLVD